jgi:hypothetical protein
MKNYLKVIYLISTIAIIISIGIRLTTDKDIVWPVIALLWCVNAAQSDYKLTNKKDCKCN